MSEWIGFQLLRCTKCKKPHPLIPLGAKSNCCGEPVEPYLKEKQ
jgi:hypothetical protein